MTLIGDVPFDIASATICAVLILVRCGYRFLSRCKSHTTCHRTWHVDDAYMAFALLPLALRTTCISLSFVLNPEHAHSPPTEAEALALNQTVAQLSEDYVLSNKLLIPGRIGYALFLWSLKLCLLSFYSRFVHVLRWGHLATQILWWFIVITFFVILIPTLGECRPLHLAWALETHKCQKALGNLITMAVFNIVTDIALVIFPFPILRYIQLDTKAKIPLIFLFCLAGLLIGITVVRLPLIINESMTQRSRSMWASIEILCACIVANTAFFYALLKDFQRGHDSRPEISSVPRNDFYLQSLPSLSGQASKSDPERAEGSRKYNVSIIE